MKVLLILPHAPDYREHFLRLLGSNCELTVIARSCSEGRLIPPDTRNGYNYIESLNIINILWLRFQPIVCSHSVANYDIIMCPLNINDVSFLFLLLKSLWLKKVFIWRGHIFGRKHHPLLSFIRYTFLKIAPRVLAYDENTALLLRDKLKVYARSFNNSHISANDYIPLQYSCDIRESVNLLFVGRYQSRKKIERLFPLLAEHRNIYLRLIGPDFVGISIPDYIKHQVALYPRLVGPDLIPHFRWSHIIVNPGHLGLLVVTAAMYSRTIVIDNLSVHAPEVYLAKETDQCFVNFANTQELYIALESLFSNNKLLLSKALSLHEKGKQLYNIEFMVNAHMEFFQECLSPAFFK